MGQRMGKADAEQGVVVHQQQLGHGADCVASRGRAGTGGVWAGALAYG